MQKGILMMQLFSRQFPLFQ